MPSGPATAESSLTSPGLPAAPSLPIATAKILLVRNVFTNTVLPSTAMPSSTPPDGPNAPSAPAHTSSDCAPGFSRATCMFCVSLAYALPSLPTAMSLQNAPAVGRFHLPFGAPLLRSNANSADGGGGGVPAGGGGPKDGVPEHAQSVLPFSSANTPNTEPMPLVFGRMNGSAVAAPAFARKICPVPMLPT